MAIVQQHSTHVDDSLDGILPPRLPDPVLTLHSASRQEAALYGYAAKIISERAAETSPQPGRSQASDGRLKHQVTS